MPLNDNYPSQSAKVKASNIRVCVRIRPILSTDAAPSPSQKRSNSGIPPRKATPVPPSLDSLSVTENSVSDVSRSTSQASLAWKILDQATLSPTNSSSNNNNNALINNPSYTVDAAFGPNSTTLEIYDSCVKDLVRSAVIEGYHAAVLAYGQTNAGKTFTMLGNNSSSIGRQTAGKLASSLPLNASTFSTDGIVQLAVQHVFRCMREQSFREEAREYLLRVTFIEIYNEAIHDLLAPTSNSSNVSVAPQSQSMSSSNNAIRIFESKTEGVIIRGLHEEIATTPEQVMDILHRGQKHRQIAATGLNANSSRSHTIFRLVIESSSSASRKISLNNSVRISSLSLVDLAGSECAKQAISLPIAQSTNADVRQREGQYINKSLLTLAHVIYKLSEMNNRTGGTEVDDGGSISVTNNAHIPYRDSKLTRILQPSLSGNAQICIICLISPLMKNMDESHNTLKFACRAKRIRQYATVNEVIDDKSLPTLLQNYRDEIDQLKEQLRQAKDAQLMMMQRQQNQNQQSPSCITVDHDIVESDYIEMQDAETVEDDDIQVLVQAIHNLEDLIIKTSSNQSRDNSPGRQIILDGMESVVDFITPLKETNVNPGYERVDQDVFNENDSFDSTMVITQANAKTASHLITSNNQYQTCASTDSHSSVRPSAQKLASSHDDESLSSRDEDNSTIHSNLIDELHRIQELLGSILRRKEMNSSSSKQSVRSAIRTKSPELYSSISSIHRDEEVLRLRSQLEEHTLAGSMRKADLSFLEFQLQQKDALLTDISGILESVEGRQRQLEKENARLKKELVQVKDELSSRCMCICMNPNDGQQTMS